MEAQHMAALAVVREALAVVREALAD